MISCFITRLILSVHAIWMCYAYVPFHHCIRYLYIEHRIFLSPYGIVHFILSAFLYIEKLVYLIAETVLREFAIK